MFNVLQDELATAHIILPPINSEGAHLATASSQPDPVALPRDRRIHLLALAAIIFFTTCGGAFGLEPLIGAVGPALSLVFILVTPLLWSLPTALMVAELTALLPEEGGFYIWVRESFGPIWAVQQACWTMTISVIWLAMYPILFVGYLSFLIPALSAPAHPFLRWIITVVMIASGLLLNLRGSHNVGNAAQIVTAFVLGAFVVMLIAWLARMHNPGALPGILHRDLLTPHPGALLLGISYTVFNYSSWDSVSTYAGEVDQPQRNYPRAIAYALLLTVICYLVPVSAGVTVTTDASVWSSDQGWPVIARLIAGRWLGTLMAIGGLASIWGLFNGQLLYVSRLPYVLARDGWLPKLFAKTSDTAAPRAALIAFCGLTALFTAFSLGSLAIIQCVLYCAALTLDFLALLILRAKYPKQGLTFRVPGGSAGLAYVCIAPFIFASFVMYAALRDWRSYPGQLLVIPCVAVAGALLYFLRRNRSIAQNQ
ncbi:MAG TPA: APC family permease [Candidatus Koribacter sp.]